MNTRFFRHAAAFGLCFSVFTAQAAQVYTCHIGGLTVYTSRPSASCRLAQLPAIGSYSGYLHNEPAAAPTAKRKTRRPVPHPTAPVIPAAAPIPAETAPARSSRQTILQEELANERKALQEAQSRLIQAQHGNDPQQIQALQTAVSDRQQNIQALQRELSRK
ncbi:hypothetical protein ACOR62_07745 [Neisseria lisongii]|uniref:Periplasmic protein n=1 Tax=Neisseria lisongii TaxID=2912188 RepID=A0AAW5AP30_9NEIS|nr:hypothetical protein [Neisseria lisongii]MCF7529683.1 hypothetical protein [Neisseria lisongii]